MKTHGVTLILPYFDLTKMTLTYGLFISESVRRRRFIFGRVIG